MAETGSFPLAIETVAVRGRTPSTATEACTDVRAVALGMGAVFALGTIAAAAGIACQAQGYGALSIAAGAVIGVASGFPLWLLLRRPRGSR